MRNLSSHHICELRFGVVIQQHPCPSPRVWWVVGAPLGAPLPQHPPFTSALVAGDLHWAYGSSAVSAEGGPRPLWGSGLGSGHTERLTVSSTRTGQDKLWPLSDPQQPQPSFLGWCLRSSYEPAPGNQGQTAKAIKQPDALLLLFICLFLKKSVGKKST